MTAPADADTATAATAAAVATVSAARRRRLAWLIVPPVAALVLGIVIWQLIIVIWSVPGYLMPSPLTMFRTIRDGMSSMWTPTWVTVRESYTGFVIAGVAGVLSGLVMARWRVFERGLYPYLIIVQTLPIVAIAPLFVVWLGAGTMTNTLVGAMIALFPVAANTLQGLKSTDRNLVQLYTMAGAPPIVQMLSLRLPAALPSILTGLRVAAGASVIGAIVGEFVAGVGGGQGGLGYVITESAVQLQTPQLFLAVLMASVVSLVLFAIVVTVERRLLRRWHESALPADE